MSILERLKRNRILINKELTSYLRRKYFSPCCYADSIVTSRALAEHLTGRCIDVGCGDLPYKELIESKVDVYDTLDIEKRRQEVKYVADIQDMNIIGSNVYDSALCLEVLEHVPDPFQAVSEIHRILKKGGKLVLSVPHLSRLHEEPHDYYRFTKYGLDFMFKRQGFKVISIEPVGGFFCFVGHQISSLLLLPVWHIPLLKSIIYWLNKWLVVRFCFFMDKIFDKQKLFAMGYTCKLEKI
ncbi:MAG: class I SAM-dependent methyltransferase [Kangiellaceae bacterium]|nr:class I SAM-dependent methyltransferase [Kangiellaceae bacterium]MCW8997646.1 class I SAM-dependent methyltransferase [Kangiellaceae bacterium]MCW9018413.1 class I SAM-dependent methyltransferase [Kangiellaceae bacterium]